MNFDAFLTIAFRTLPEATLVETRSGPISALELRVDRTVHSRFADDVAEREPFTGWLSNMKD